MRQKVGNARPPLLGEGIADLEERELAEIGVARVEDAHAVLLQQGGEMGIGHEVAAHGETPRDCAVDIQEPGLFGQETNVRPCSEPFDVPQRLRRGQWRCE